MTLTYPEAADLEGLLVARGAGRRSTVTVQVQLAMHRWRTLHAACGEACAVVAGKCVEDLVEV